MGKSNKKIKNDRINTLRKQYDAYLEEDKKRRERNEYILKQLDKMRYSSALVPVSTEANYHQHENLSDVYMRPEKLEKMTIYDDYIPKSERQNLTSDILPQKMDECSILKEISKRYILIPKRRTAIDIDYTHSKDVISNEDWRSKYDILENIKKQEKEGQSDYETIEKNNNEKLNRSSYEDVEPISDKISQNFDNDSNKLLSDKNNALKDSFLKDPVNKTVDFEIPEVNSKINNINKTPLNAVPISLNEDMKLHNTNPPHIIDHSNTPATHEIIQSHRGSTEQNEEYSPDTKENYLNYQPSQDIKKNTQVTEENVTNLNNFQDSTHLSNYNQSKPVGNEPEGYGNVNNSLYSEEIVPDINPQDYNEVQFSENTERPSENMGNQEDVSKVQDLPYLERVYDNTVETPGGNQIVVDQTVYETSQDYDPALEGIPVVLENTEHTEHVDHDSEINAFEAEQKDMFYTEETGGDTYAYGQGDGATGEYAADNYEHNNQYAYYEGVQQEQAYATIVNEHEEATERYDPHYNEQYEGTYDTQHPSNTADYENSNTYEQHQYQEGSYEKQQLDNVVNYESQQENVKLYEQENVSNANDVQENVAILQDNEAYDQQVYAEQHDTQEQIEQQLIVEEGYVENAPILSEEVKEEHEGEIERVMDITNPLDAMPDPKLS